MNNNWQFFYLFIGVEWEYFRALQLFFLQTRPVPFTVQAVLTNSDMEFDTTKLDFGCCTIYESVKHTVHLSNKSILPQEYGFLNIPDVSLYFAKCVLGK